MRRSVYAVIGVAGDKPMATWLLAHDPDEAIAKASKKLPEGVEIRHTLRVCVASISEFQRNKLLSVIDQKDAIEFTSEAIIHLVQIQQFNAWEMGKTIRQLRETLERIQRQLFEQEKQNESEL